MLEQTLGILFYQKKPKNYLKGAIPIYLRITVNGVRTEIGTKYSCELDRWNSHAQRVKGTNETSRTINASLDALERQVHNARLNLMENNTSINAASLKNILIGKKERELTLLKVFKQHNEQLVALIYTEFAPATIKRYNTTYEHVLAFLKWKYQLNDIDLKMLTFQFATEFEFYLKSVKKCNHNTAIKYVGNLRKIVNYCIKNQWLKRDPFFGYKMAKKEVIREFLTQDEIEKISKKQFEILRLAQVRDIFLFSCYTGLAFIDVFNLTPSHVAKGIDDNLWIFTSRQKTDTPSRIPLLPPALAILENYKPHPKCINEGKLLPMLSNQKMNSYLKEIADLCGITKPLTFHIARHTFATTITLNNGVPIESVSKMLGHKSIRITQHYAKVLDKKVSEDMNLLHDKLKITSTIV
jgi:site-specific recombinase XerD